MASDSQPRAVFTFGDYELDCRSHELRKRGRTLRVQQQQFQVLSMLVSAAGAVVTRDELRERIWNRDTFVDFDRAINKAVHRLRQVLNDDIARPRFIETVPKCGYRFVAPIASRRSHLRCIGTNDVSEILLKARHFWNRRTVKDLRRSLDYFRRAIEKQPECTDAWAGLADTYVMLGHFGLQRPDDAFPAAKTAALRALDLDGASAEAHTTLGEIHKLYEWNWDAAERSYRRAIELNPDYVVAHHWYAQLLAVGARHEEALAEIEAARRCDLLSVPVNAFVAYVWLEGREYQRAIAAADDARELDANAPLPYLLLGRAYAKCEDFQNAIRAFRTAARLAGVVPLIEANLGYAYARAGLRPLAARILERLRRARFAPQASAMELGLVSLGLGDKDAAMAALEEAHRTRAVRMLAITDPFYSELAGEPRYRELVARLGLPLRT
jgi:DNA-binding winged helix-turn-helix (wHTH) protein/tetratricopeptide (TPR) repeat protein